MSSGSSSAAAGSGLCRCSECSSVPLAGRQGRLQGRVRTEHNVDNWHAQAEWQDPHQRPSHTQHLLHRQPWLGSARGNFHACRRGWLLGGLLCQPGCTACMACTACLCTSKDANSSPACRMEQPSVCQHPGSRCMPPGCCPVWASRLLRRPDAAAQAPPQPQTLNAEP